MFDILDGYVQIVQMLEFRQNHSDLPDAEGAAIAIFHTHTSLLDDIDTWLAPLEKEAQETLLQTDGVLLTVARVVAEIWEAQSEVTTEWENFHTEVPEKFQGTCRCTRPMLVANRKRMARTIDLE